MADEEQGNPKSESVEIIGADEDASEAVDGFRQPLGSAPTHKDKTARTLAIGCFAALCVVFLINYISVFWLAYRNRTDAIQHVNRIFSTWVPIFAGLVGSAATFYFTQERR